MGRKKNAEPKIGDNSHINPDDRKKLKGYVDQIVGLEREKAETQADIKGLYQSVNDANFSVKAVRRLVKQRLMTREQKLKEQALADLTDVYDHALENLAGTVFEGAAQANTQMDLSQRTDLPQEVRA